MTWLILIVVVVLVAVGYFFFRGSGVGSHPPLDLSFTPNPENDKVILVKGWNESEMTKIIRDFVETYKDERYPAFTIKPDKQSEDFHRLTFPEDIHPMLFTFLVNYVAYPFDLELSNRSIIVGGKTTLSFDFEEIDPLLVGDKAILYIPENDQDHDVVYMRTESGATLANSFTEMKWRSVNAARLSNEVKNLVGL